MIGHFTLLAVAFAADLSPRRAIALDGGPMKVRPQLSQIEAKLAFSLKKPYPGCTASAPVISQAAMRLDTFKIRFRGRGFSDADRLIGMMDMERFGVGFRIDGHSLQGQDRRTRG